MHTRTLIILSLLGLACAGDPADRPVARLGDRVLTPDRLAEILVLAQPLPLDEATATDLAQHWLEVSLVADRAAAGDSLLAPAMVRAAMAPDFRELRIAKRLEGPTREARERAEAMTDSVYAAGEVRLLAHVFRRVAPDARPGEKEFQCIAAEEVRKRLLAGGAWADEARQSEDPDTRDRGGVIGLVRRRDLPPGFESVAFRLGPGELSNVVETAYGYHVIRRPGLAEARPTFTRLLADEFLAEAESRIGDRLLADARLSVLPDAASRTRAMGRNPWAGLDREDVLVRHERGRLVEDDAARGLLLLGPGAREALMRASDVEVEGFLRGLVLRELLAAGADSAGLAADSAGLAADSADVVQVTDRYREAIETLWRTANISPDSLAAAGAPDRVRLAADRVEDYIEALVARRVEIAPVPPLLTVVLLDNVDWDLDEVAIGQAVERARRMLAAAEAR